jgi:Family of unknown function (DUF6454)
MTRTSLLLLVGCLCAGTPPRSLADLKLERVLELKGATYHVQGVDIDGQRVWVTSVDTADRKGYLHEFSLKSGELLRQVEVTDGIRFHPGGISSDRTSLWIPVAEYRRNSTSVIERRSKRTLQLESQFQVSDHIGCVAVTGKMLVGGNWDSHDFYIWDQKGNLQRKAPSGSGNAYQDIKFDSGTLVASGLLADGSGAVDWLDPSSFRILRRLAAGNTDRGAPYTREGMAVGRQQLLFVPEDYPSRLFVFKLTRTKTPTLVEYAIADSGASFFFDWVFDIRQHLWWHR